MLLITFRSMCRPLALVAATVLCPTVFARSFAPYPYGANAQLTRNEFENHDKALEMMAIAGIRHVRIPLALTDKYMVKDGRIDFSVSDKVFANCDRFGISVLPIIDAVGEDPNAILADATKMAEFKSLIREVLLHYRGRFQMMEFWNEPNLNIFWKNPDASNYVSLLKVVRGIQAETDPSLKIAIAGVASSSVIPYLRKCYEAGVKDVFDIMNVHKYCHPGGPEGWFDLTDLKSLMAEFGDDDKPVIVTETGWQTHLPVVPCDDLIRAGLALARPGGGRMNAIHCDFFAEGVLADQRSAQALRRCLPYGGTVESCPPRETARRLEKGGVDVVIYPFSQTFPSETLEAVEKFVARGGILVDFADLPLWRGGTDMGPDASVKDGETMRRFRFGMRSRHSRNGNFPDSVAARPTSAAIAAGAQDCEYVCTKYLCQERAAKGDTMIPIVSGRDASGQELVPAAVFRNAAGGAVVACTVPSRNGNRRSPVGSSTEAEQAAKTVRALSILFAQGVDAVFVYEFRGWEIDPWESELHFGLVHANYVPKPAYSAYMNFVVQRPVGSKRTAGDWTSADGRTYFPCWTRPDGKSAGMAWTIDPPHSVEMKFDGEAAFCDMYGTPRLFKRTGEHSWSLQVSGEPVYFSGARLLGMGREEIK